MERQTELSQLVESTEAVVRTGDVIRNDGKPPESAGAELTMSVGLPWGRSAHVSSVLCTGVSVKAGK